MKKTVFAVILLIFILTLVGCKSNERINFLNYQSYPFKAHGVLTYDGTEYETNITVEQMGGIALEIIKPAELSGMSFIYENGSVTVKTEDFCQTVSDGEYAASEGILLAAKMFSLSGDCLSGSEIINENGVRYCKSEYTVPRGSVFVYIQEGLTSPEKLTATIGGHDFSFVFMNE